MKAAQWLPLLVLVVPLALAGCRPGPTDRQPSSGGPADQEYDLRGKVTEVAPDGRSVTLAHEDIPGLMKAMTMKFRVDDPKVLEGIQAGDQVQGRLRVQADSYTVTRLEKR